ncbi:TetR/AcrR family transcriptional regulator [Candidatus Gracilibacteria bacterium]|nr:TetR/AcrR family transcriptional regulator [Candidatus Gracilibacteria bacterium]
MSHHQHTRRKPRQDRGEQRVTAILNAAGVLFAEIGYEATTMSDIAERAHTSFGSLYQFFPNKEAVAEAVASRYLDQFREVLHAAQSEDLALLPFDALVNALIDPFIAFVSERPGFQVFLKDAKRLTQLAAAQALYQEALQWVDQLLMTYKPMFPTLERHVAATIVVQWLSRISRSKTFASQHIWLPNAVGQQQICIRTV